jgi:hypothetical protein
MQPDAGPPSDGSTPDATLDSSNDAPSEAAVDSSLPDAASAPESGAGDADETGSGDAPVDTSGGGSEGGGMDAGMPEAEAGLSGTFTIVNHETGWLVDNSGGSSSPGNPVIQYPANGGTNQEWTVLTVSGAAVLLFNKQSNLVLDVSGTNVDQAAVISGRTTQEWMFSPSGSAGYYTITSVGGGGVLTSPNSSQAAQLVVSVGNGGPSQEWQLVPVP